MSNRIFTFLMSLVAVCLLGSSAFAQGTITGMVVDADNQEALVGARVVLKGSARGALSDLDGRFSITADAGDYEVLISYIGYVDLTENVSVTNGGTADLGTIRLNSSVVGLAEVEIIASLATDRKTPVAVSTISGDKVEALVGNQEFPEILRSTPSVYVTKQGGGFGDSRINVRGFDQRNTAVMINGIPVNDMENGWVYWSNWAGLSDVTSTIQVQRGLGASKLAVATVGGSINIVTNAADFEKGGAFSAGIGNDGYQKYAVVLSSGLNDNGWAATAQMTHTRGDGWVDGTMFRAYSYFLSVSKTFNERHTLSFTGLGAPQWHNQRNAASRFDRINMQTFRDLDSDTYDGRRWNHLWGDLDGEEFSFRKNFYHKPKFFMNHYWNMSSKTNLKTSAYASYGRGGGTGPRGRLRTPGSVFDSFGGFGSGIHDQNGQIRFNDLVRYHQGMAFEGWGQKIPASAGPFAGQYVSSSNGRVNGSGDEGTGFIRRASMNYHDWYGVLSTLTHQLSDNLTLVAGLDGRYYIGEHFRRVENLLGNDAYLSQSDVNNPANYITEVAPADFGNFHNTSYLDGNNVLNYHNDGLVNWASLFAQVEYSTDQLTVFGSVSGANQGFKRIDYFIYDDADPIRESDWENFLGGTVKAGANFNINENMNVFVNGGFFSQQPIFDNVFINFSNNVNPDVENQQVRAIEAGYGYRSSNFRLNLNVYNTFWGNRQFSRSIAVQLNDTSVVDGLANFSNVAQRHQGVELEMSWKPIYNLTLSGMVSLNNWVYADDFTANIQDTDNQQSLGTATIYGAGVKVGDAAQTTLNINADYQIIDGLSVYGNFYYADNLYADFNILEDQFLDGPGAQAVKLPSYSLVDAGASFAFDAGPTEIIIRANVNNVLDTWYISELETNVVDTSAELNGLYLNRGHWGFGRTWNLSAKVRF